MKNKVYDVIASRIFQHIEAGGLPPWCRPWGMIGGQAPMNLITKIPYRGVNAMLLSLLASSFGSPYFITFKQVNKLGGKIIKGSHSFPIIFWSFIDDKDESGNPVLDAHGRNKKHVLIRYYNVFNVAQVEGIENKIPVVEKPEGFKTIDKAEEVVKSYTEREHLKVFFGGNRAYYSPKLDEVHLPKRDQFNRPVNFYATTYHELGHSTGAKDRLNRKGVADFDSFGTERYAKEELIAELTCTFLCGVCGFEEKIEKDSESYLKGWLKVLKDDPSMLIEAAQGAQKAADYILGVDRDASKTHED